MARRFRRLRRAASQVIEVTRRFWRFCHCCGTMRTCYGRDVIPVSAALSCTNLPPARSPILCCHLPIKEGAHQPCVTTESLSIGPQNWIRPTDSGPRSNDDRAVTQPAVPGPDMPGSFSNDYQVTPSGICFSTSVSQPHGMHRDSYVVSEPWRSPSHSFCSVPVPIWSANSSYRRDNHAYSRFLREPRLVRNPPYWMGNNPGTSNSSSSSSFISPSGLIKFLSYEFEKPSSNRLTTSTNSNTPSLPPVGVPHISGRRVERLRREERNVDHVQYTGRPDCPAENVTRVHDVPKVETTSSVQSSNITTVLAVLGTSHSANTPLCSTIALPGSSPTDPVLRLNLNLLQESCAGIVTAPEIRVEFTIKEDWNDIDPGNWHHRKTLARTKFGQVALAFCDKFRQDYVLKTLPADDYNTEVEILQQCQSPFVAEMQAVLTKGEDRLLCMSYYDRLDLSYWLGKDQNRDHFAEAEATLICSYILTGLEFMHNKGYLHLDIKPGNILLSAKGYPVIGDFGSARSIDNNRGHFRRYTPSYACPEILRGDAPTNQADLWSSACLFYEVVAGQPPYKGQTRAETEMKILTCATPDVSMFSLDAQHFMCSQMKSDKTDRLGFSFGAREVTRHRIFHSINWDRIKYGHRHSDCRLLKVLQAVEKNDAESSQSSSNSVCNSNNSGRWELWFSSSTEDSDEEFGYSHRVIYTLHEEEQGYRGSETPTRSDNGEKANSYGAPDRQLDVDEDDSGGG